MKTNASAVLHRGWPGWPAGRLHTVHTDICIIAWIPTQTEWMASEMLHTAVRSTTGNKGESKVRKIGRRRRRRRRHRCIIEAPGFSFILPYSMRYVCMVGGQWFSGRPINH